MKIQIIATGPIACGKSTAINAMIAALRKNAQFTLDSRSDKREEVEREEVTLDLTFVPPSE